MQHLPNVNEQVLPFACSGLPDIGKGHCLRH
jgi:hypothetical protein